MSAEVMKLAAYRDLIDLDQQVDPPGPALASDLPTAITGLTDEARARGVDVQPDPDPNRTLRSLLTIRPPGPMPDAVTSAVERLLGEKAAQVQAAPLRDLTTIGDRFQTHYPAATRTALWQGDITTVGVDAIVNAANEALLGCFIPFHRCIDNGIHTAAGPRLREDCAAIMSVQGHSEPTGAAKVTRGYHLPARFVVHTVGPIVAGANPTDADQQALASSYRSCLELVAEVATIRSIAFCSISTGVFGYPIEAAAPVALRTVADWLASNPDRMDLVVFNVFSDGDRATYEQSLERW